jgi:hypothetical protein
MEIEQLAAGARALPQVFAEMAKSDELVPAMASPVSDSALPPLLVSVMLCEVAVEPTV